MQLATEPEHDPSSSRTADDGELASGWFCSSCGAVNLEGAQSCVRCNEVFILPAENLEENPDVPEVPKRSFQQPRLVYRAPTYRADHIHILPSGIRLIKGGIEIRRPREDERAFDYAMMKYVMIVFLIGALIAFGMMCGAFFSTH